MRLAVLACLALAAPLSNHLLAAPRAQDDPLARALELVREQRDAVAPAVLEALAAGRDAAGLEALREATRLLATPGALSLVYGLAARYRGVDGLEGSALGWLEEDALGAHAGRCLAATEGLVAFEDDGVDALRRVFERSPDAAVRATALGPLLPGLRIEGTVEALDLALANWRQPESGPYEVAVRSLAGFRRDPHLARFERTLHDERTPAELRALVLDALTAMPTEGADGVLVRSLDQDDDTLQVAAIQALEARGRSTAATPGDPPAPIGWERHVDALTDSGAPAVRAAAWVALAGRVPEDSRYRRRLGLLVRHTDGTLRAAAATVLGRARYPEAEADLVTLLADEEWRVRSAALDACLTRRTAALVPVLIERLDAEGVAHRDRVRDVLIGLTAVDHGGASARWRAFWAAEGAARPVATEAEVAAFLASRSAREAGEGRSTVQFFGIPITSDRVAFVVDASGSMSALVGSGARPRIEVAKAKLLEVLDRLEPTARFNVVWFANRASAWRRGLVPRTAANLRSARAFVDGRDADGGTALYDGLIAAWRDRDVEAIYLLSDGAPSAGRLVAPDEILADVRARFARRPVAVHGIAVGTPSPLLRAIAEATGGVYREVD